MSDRRPESFAKLTREHLKAAARAWNPTEGYPPFRRAPQRWYVVIDRRRYPPKAITALAHDLARLGRLTPADFSGAEGHGFLHETLRGLGFRVIEKGGSIAPATRGRPLGNFTVGRRPTPGDIDARHVREAARHWARDRAFLNFSESLRYDVWIDPHGDGKLAPFPPKAIVSLAAAKAGRRPLRPEEFSGMKDGGWHNQLKDLGFPVLPKGQRPMSGRPSRGSDETPAPKRAPRTVKVTHRPGAAPRRVNLDTLRKALDGDEPVLVEKDKYEARLDTLLRDPKLPAAVKREVASRLGQGEFRNGLLAAYGGRCVLTGIDVPEVLRAAHIRRWADCKRDPSARHDLHNGLLLYASLDSLFEAGLIAFDDHGKILISRRLSAKTREQLGLRQDMRLPGIVSPRRRRYLQAHRKRTQASRPEA